MSVSIVDKQYVLPDPDTVVSSSSLHTCHVCTHSPAHTVLLAGSSDLPACVHSTVDTAFTVPAGGCSASSHSLVPLSHVLPLCLPEKGIFLVPISHRHLGDHFAPEKVEVLHQKLHMPQELSPFHRYTISPRQRPVGAHLHSFQCVQISWLSVYFLYTSLYILNSLLQIQCFSFGLWEPSHQQTACIGPHLFPRACHYTCWCC